ncbi:hypothetical protein RJ639_031858 [Escallonia herrerae]|uniref:F-box domain-containing protein n=1 Tax=Escallonia herrerae TaxID=1293975 RepID=A0AA89BII6_9ASTE|nr:hypothetical protein RJ639_031858 [Escallonia herrerae]
MVLELESRVSTPLNTAKRTESTTTSSSELSEWEWLPDDLLISILDRLAPSNCINVLAVCKRWLYTVLSRKKRVEPILVVPATSTDKEQEEDRKPLSFYSLALKRVSNPSLAPNKIYGVDSLDWASQDQVLKRFIKAKGWILDATYSSRGLLYVMIFLWDQLYSLHTRTPIVPMKEVALRLGSDHGYPDECHIVESSEGDILLVVCWTGMRSYNVFKLLAGLHKLERLAGLGDGALFLCGYSSMYVSASEVPECRPNSINITYCSKRSTGLQVVVRNLKDGSDTSVIDHEPNMNFHDMPPPTLILASCAAHFE